MTSKVALNPTNSKTYSNPTNHEMFPISKKWYRCLGPKENQWYVAWSTRNNGFPGVTIWVEDNTYQLMLWNDTHPDTHVGAGYLRPKVFSTLKDLSQEILRLRKYFRENPVDYCEYGCIWDDGYIHSQKNGIPIWKDHDEQHTWHPRNLEEC